MKVASDKCSVKKKFLVVDLLWRVFILINIYCKKSEAD